MLDQIDDIIQNNGGDVFHNNDTTAVYILVYADFRVANFASLLLRFCFTFASRLLHVCRKYETSVRNIVTPKRASDIKVTTQEEVNMVALRR